MASLAQARKQVKMLRAKYDQYGWDHKPCIYRFERIAPPENYGIRFHSLPAPAVVETDWDGRLFLVEEPQ